MEYQHDVTENTINFIMSKMGEGFHTRMIERVFEELKSGREVVVFDDEFMFEEYEEVIMELMIKDFSFESDLSLQVQNDIYNALTKRLTFATKLNQILWHQDDSEITVFFSPQFLSYADIVKTRRGYKNINMYVTLAL